MATINFTDGETLTDMLVKVAVATGNGILDVGYLCSDSRPYFKFVNGSTEYYTTLHPSNTSGATTVSVYRYTNDKMELVGNGSQNTNVLTYGGTTYANTSNTYIDVRLHKINKWAKYKPIIYENTSDILTDSQFEEKHWGLSWPSADSKILDLQSIFKYYPPTGGAIPYRLRDFNGYSHTAQPIMAASNIYIDSAFNLHFTIKYASSEDSTAVPFSEYINGIMSTAGKTITDYAPCVIVQNNKLGASAIIQSKSLETSMPSKETSVQYSINLIQGSTLCELEGEVYIKVSILAYYGGDATRWINISSSSESAGLNLGLAIPNATYLSYTLNLPAFESVLPTFTQSGYLWDSFTSTRPQINFMANKIIDTSVATYSVKFATVDNDFYYNIDATEVVVGYLGDEARIYTYLNLTGSYQYETTLYYKLIATSPVGQEKVVLKGSITKKS